MSSEPPATPPQWLQIWVEAGREGQVFTYANPQRLALAPGDLVQVPLRGRRQSGLVVDVLTALPDGLAGRQLQPVERLLQAAAVTAGWQQLVDQVAQACHTTRFQTLKAVLPAAWLGQRRQGPVAAQRQRWLIEGPLADLTPQRLTASQQALLQALEEAGGSVPMPLLCRAGGHSRAVLKALERRGLVRRTLEQPAAPALQPPQRLNADQARALEAIEAAQGGQSLLLWGVTGAGKTEVYLQAAARMLEQGRSVMVLSPEIGLIPQLLDRARSRFGDAVLEYHSGMADGERVSSWRAALDPASPRVVVGLSLIHI